MKNIPVHKNITYLQTDTLNLTASIDITNELGRKFEENSNNSSLDSLFLVKKKSGSNISIKHLLLECRQFNEERTKHNIPSSIAECLNNEPKNINSTPSFIKETYLYKTI